MKSRVKVCNRRCIWELFKRRSDECSRRLVMQWCKFNQRLEVMQRVFINGLSLLIVSSVNDAMADVRQILCARRGAEQVIEDVSQCLVMVLDPPYVLLFVINVLDGRRK